jgi:hypothetical protein
VSASKNGAFLLCGALLFALGGGVDAQAPSPSPKERRFDCSKAKDPKACEQRLAKARAARELCAQSGDPAKCEENAKRRAARGARLPEACKDKKGEELRGCIREQRRKK